MFKKKVKIINAELKYRNVPLKVVSNELDKYSILTKNMLQEVTLDDELIDNIDADIIANLLCEMFEMGKYWTIDELYGKMDEMVLDRVII